LPWAEGGSSLSHGGVQVGRHESVETLCETYIAASKLNICAIASWTEKTDPLKQSANSFAKTEAGQDYQSLNVIT